MFSANPVTRFNPITLNQEWLYSPDLDAFQYRVKVPGIEISMVMVNVTQSVLRRYNQNKRPITIVPQDDKPSCIISRSY